MSFTRRYEPNAITMATSVIKNMNEIKHLRYTDSTGYAIIEFFKIGRIVYGTIVDGGQVTASAETVVATFPEDYRPVSLYDFFDSHSKTRFIIGTSGNMTAKSALSKAFIRGSFCYVSAK